MRILRSEGWRIVQSEAVDIGDTKGELINWLNANFKVSLIAD
jgi:hypothetical protein